MKAAVIGIGGMGRHHARIYKELGLLVAVCDTKTSGEASDKYGVQGYHRVEDLLSIHKPNVVSVCVPTPMHCEIVKLCLEAGADVLVEKPISSSTEEALDMLAYAQRYNRVLAVGYIERFNPAFVALQNLKEEGFFGDITSVNIKRVGGIPRSAQNVIIDLMTHDFDLLSTLFKQQPNKISIHKDSHSGIVDSAQALLAFGDASATCEANWISPTKIRRIEVTGTKGYCTVDLIQQTLTKKTETIEVMQRYPGEPLFLELVGFLESTKDAMKGSIVTAQGAYDTLLTTQKAATQ